MSQMLPPQIAQMLQQGPPDQGGADPLSQLQDCMNQLHTVIAALPDPQDTQDAIGALQILARVQTRLQKASPGASQPPR